MSGAVGPPLTWGAPSFAVFAKGGNHSLMYQEKCYATRLANEIFGHPSFKRTIPGSFSR